MSEYRIGFLDENELDRDTFGDFVDKHFPEYEYVGLAPEENMELMTEYIWQQDLDCLVIDYKLNTRFNGSEVYDAVISSRRDFPVIILTSHPDDAVEQSHEPTQIYDKSVIFNKPRDERDENDLKLLAKKLNFATEKYRNKIKDYETEHKMLSQKGELSEQEIAKLVKVDNYLDANCGYGDKPQIPADYAAKTHTRQLHELIEKTDQLLNKYDDK